MGLTTTNWDNAQNATAYPTNAVEKLPPISTLLDNIETLMLKNDDLLCRIGDVIGSGCQMPEVKSGPMPLNEKLAAYEELLRNMGGKLVRICEILGIDV